MKSKKIGMVYCYMGQWPGYLSLFLESCRYNPSVDFILFTDCGKPEDCPANVSIIPFSLKDFNKLASIKLGFRINVKSPYKLCDFKPCYGVIFEDYITNYDYWGYGDIDIIFGDIRKFITDDVLNNYELITAGKEFLIGHFTLMRNSLKMNRLYENSADHKKALQAENYCSFDECHSWMRKEGMATILELRKGANIFDCVTEIESMTHVVQKLYNKGELKVLFKALFKDGSDIRVDYNDYSFIYKWEKGKLTDIENGEEFMYIHLFGLKRNAAFTDILKWEKVPNQLVITKNELATNKVFNEHDLREIVTTYSQKYFPRTTDFLSVFLTDHLQELYETNNFNNVSYIEVFTSHFYKVSKQLPIRTQERLNDVFWLENIKLRVNEAIQGFGHFAFNLPGRDLLEGKKEVDFTADYVLHKDTQLIETKWSWALKNDEKAHQRNIALLANHFYVILAPTFFEVTEEYIPKHIFYFLKHFTIENSFLNALKLTTETLPGIDIDEKEIKEHFERLVLSGILLKTKSNK